MMNFKCLNIKLKHQKLIKILAYLSALLLLIFGIFISLKQNPDLLSNINISSITLLLIIGAPFTIILNAAEFLMSARLINVDIGFKRALETTILGSAANMLPIPGSTAIRIGALKMSGANIKSSASATFLMALLWITLSFFISGIALLINANRIIGFQIVSASFIFFIVALIWKKRANMPIIFFIYSIMIKITLILMEAVKMLWCFQTLNLEISFSQASVFVISSVLGAMISIVPAGLGLREMVSAALAPLVNISPSTAFIATTMNRLIELFILTLLVIMIVMINFFTKAREVNLNN